MPLLISEVSKSCDAYGQPGNLAKKYSSLTTCGFSCTSLVNEAKFQSRHMHARLYLFKSDYSVYFNISAYYEYYIKLLPT